MSLWRVRRCQPCLLPSRSDAETLSEPASSGRPDGSPRLWLGWRSVEAAVAVAAGVVAGSVALVGFGADSLIEAALGTGWWFCGW